MRPVILLTLAALAVAVPLDTEHVARTPALPEIRDTPSVEQHLDTRQLQAMIDQLRAKVEEAAARVRAAKSRFGTASAQYRAAVDKWQQQLKLLRDALRSAV